MSNKDRKYSEWPIRKLKPDRNNTRVHPPEQIELLAAGIERHGFNSVIAVDERGVVLAGHARLAAARRLKMRTVPVMQCFNLTDEDKRAFGIADNESAAGARYDDRRLHKALTYLKDRGYDLAVTGFSDERLQRLVQSLDQDAMAQVARSGSGARSASVRGSSETETESVGDWVTYAIVVTPGQRDDIASAVNERQERRPGMKAGEAVHAICREWVAARKPRRSAAVARRR